MHRLFHLFLICVYLLPMLIGSGGMHVLLGVEHHCCSTAPEVASPHAHSSCCHHRPPVEDKRQLSEEQGCSNSSSSPMLPAGEDDCFLCQEMSLAQQVSPLVLLVKAEDQIDAVTPLVHHGPLLVVVNEHAPRGPPCC